MPDQTTEGQLRRELDRILVRLERHERTTLSEARSESARLVGDMFADAQVIASRNLDALSYERLSRRARELSNALERVRDGSYGICEECGGAIPAARRRALPGVTTCVRCQEQGEKLRARPELAAWSVRPSRVRPKNGRRDDAKT
jgi:DnaK suppressor protein